VKKAENEMEERRQEFAELQAECEQTQDEPLSPYPVHAWEGTPYLDFARIGRGEATDRPNFIPPEYLINGLMTFVGAICGHRITPAFNPTLKARFITILLSEIGGIGKDTIQGWLTQLFNKTDLIRLKGLPKYRNIGCFKGDFASERAMIQAQAANPVTLQVYGEFTTATEKMGIQGSGQSFINLLLHYADSSEPKWSMIKNEGIPDNAPDEVEVNLLGFTTKPRWDNIRLNFETFIQRVNAVYSDEKRTVARLATPDFSPIQEQILHRIALLETHRLMWDFTPEAEKLFDEWYQDLQSNRTHANDDTEVYGRIQVYVLRILGHLAFWLGELPKTANVSLERHSDGSYHFRVLDTDPAAAGPTEAAPAAAGVTVPATWGTPRTRMEHIWKVDVTPEMVKRATEIAEYELSTRLRCIPSKGDVVAAHVENTVRRWASQYGKISWAQLQRKSHIRERFGWEICRKALAAVEKAGDVRIIMDPEHREIENRWLLIWLGLSSAPVFSALDHGGRRRGAGRKKKAMG
jgi:hypothetical protein